jgi:hypothetical protein
MDNWILVRDELPINTDEVLVAFLGWDGLIFQRTLSYETHYKEWSDWNGDLYKKVIAWQSLPSDKGLR